MRLNYVLPGCAFKACASGGATYRVSMSLYFLKAFTLFVFCLILIYTMSSEHQNSKDKEQRHQHKRELPSAALHVTRGDVPKHPHNVRPGKTVQSGILLQDKRPTVDK
jgi:hypothetical protein